MAQVNAFDEIKEEGRRSAKDQMHDSVPWQVSTPQASPCLLPAARYGSCADALRVGSGAGCSDGVEDFF